MELKSHCRRTCNVSSFRKSSDSLIIHNLLKREVWGALFNRLTNPFGPVTPARLSMPMESILPLYALQNGHIFMGFTDCGRFLLSYTIREEFDNTYNRNEMAFFYKLHFWLFAPYKMAKRIASIPLFCDSGVADNNLLIDISQWKSDETRLIIVGRNCSPEIGGFRSLCYVTMTTLPTTYFCRDCSCQESYPEFDDCCAGDVRFTKSRCLRHSLTTHLAFERVPPFPKFRFDLQLNWKNSIVLNTGNALHIFTYNVSAPRNESPFTSELLIPPGHHEPKASRTRLLRCEFSFKTSTNCLQKILSNCSTREASRIITVPGRNKTEWNDGRKDEKDIQEAFLFNISVTMDLGMLPLECASVSHSRRLSQSSIDSEISVLSSLSQSTTASEITTHEIEVSETLREQTATSPIKRDPTTVMPPPQRSRKFFKTGVAPTAKKSNTKPTQRSSNSSQKMEKSYDVFEVGFEEVLLDRSLSSYRKRRNADKQYEFSDPDASSENIVPLKLSRNRTQRQSLSSIGSGGTKRNSGTDSTIVEPSDGLLSPTGFPRSPRALAIHSPAMSPNYSEIGDILRPLTNNTCIRKVSSSHSLLSPPGMRDFRDDFGSDTKIYSCPPHSPLAEDTKIDATDCTESLFGTNLNCIAKIMRSYVDKDEDALSVKTDTDDEYNQTIPFPVALNLEVHGSGYRSLQLINNAKTKFSPTPVVEVLQRTLEIEILCNEVSSMVCLSVDKNFISCFDYDVAVTDVCSQSGRISALAVVLIQATDLPSVQKNSSRLPDATETQIPKLMDPRQKYEIIFSFVWDPVKEHCNIFHVGHIKEIEKIPDKWNPTKLILQHLQHQTANVEQRVLSNELAVYEWQSVDELLDPTGLISLRSGNASCSMLHRGMSSTSFNFPSVSSLDTEDDELSD